MDAASRVNQGDVRADADAGHPGPSKRPRVRMRVVRAVIGARRETIAAVRAMSATRRGVIAVPRAIARPDVTTAVSHRAIAPASSAIGDRAAVAADARRAPQTMSARARRA